MPGRKAWHFAKSVVPLLLAVGCGIARAEEAATPGAATSKPSPGPVGPASGGGLSEAKPPLYLLKDKQGNLQAVPGFTLEDFWELYELKHRIQQRAEMPGYSLQGMTIIGAVTGNLAELTIEFRVLVRDKQCRVPLRLEQAVLRKVEHEGSGEHLVHFEEGGEGYVAWLSGEPDKPHRLTLRVVVPISSVGDEARLRLRCPRATTSEMKLTVPLVQAVGTATEPAALASATQVEGKATEFTVLGLGGDFELGWRPAGIRKAETPLALEAMGEVAARIDGRDVTAQVGLVVKAFGAPFDQFQVRLPEGSRLEDRNPVGYSLTSSGDRLVTVRFPAKALEQRAQFGFVQSRDVDKPDQWIELGGFEVVGAARHRGHIAVAATGDWHVLWKPSPEVRQTEEVPKTLQVEGLIAGFQYVSQPLSLRARLAPRKVRVSVEPEYRLLVGAKEVQLEAILKYTIRGAKVPALLVDMPGWEVDDASPDNLVIADAVGLTESKMVSIPLKQPAVGHIEVTVRARQELAPGTKALSLALPRRLQVDAPGSPAVVVLPASVVVVPDDNVELVPDEKAMVGLTRQPAPPLAGIPRRQQAPLAYRGEAATATFFSSFRVHERTVTVEASGQVQVEEQSVRVEQKLAYTISHEVLGALTVRVPRAVLGAEGLQFSVEGQVLPALPTAVPVKGPEDAGPVSRSIALPQPRIGTCDLAVSYRLPTERLTPKQSVLRTVPLVLPADGTVTSSRLSVTAADGIEVKPREGPWTVVDGRLDPSAPGRVLQMAASEPAGEVALAVHLEDTPAAGAMIVHKAWVQTWFSQAGRQDRAIYGLLTGRKQVELFLPEGVAVADVELWVDGKPILPGIEPGGRVVAPMPADGVGRLVLVEMRYHFGHGRSPRGHLAMDFPRLGQGVWIRRLYWQLILPRDEHVLVAPAGFTSEFRWGWNGFYWGRTPLWGQGDLESWIGAEHRAQPPESANCYVFSTLGEVRRAELDTAGRSVIVLLASLAALGIGLVIIYVPKVRHPASLLVTAIGLLAVGVVYPEPTLLLLQAAGLGLVLTLVAGLLQRNIARRRGVSQARPGGDFVEQGSTQTQYHPPAAGSRGSTQAAPALAPVSSSDANP